MKKELSFEIKCDGIDEAINKMKELNGQFVLFESNIERMQTKYPGLIELKTVEKENESE